MARITLSDGTYVVVDQEDFEKFGKAKWSAQGSQGYAVREVRGVRLHLHREIMGNVPKGMYVDHINHDIRDNRKCNLRIVTPAQSARNIRKRRQGRKGKSRFKGVYYHPKAHKSRPWVAAVEASGIKRVKYFATEEEAARGYDELAQEYHGEFACLNFP